MSRHGSPKPLLTGSERPQGHALALLAIVLVHVTVSWFGRNAGIGWGDDDAQYILLAKSLSQFHYLEIWDVDASFHARYPPLFPALLAIVGTATDWSVDAMLLMVAICSSLSLVLIYDAARRHVDPLLALLAVALSAINPMGLNDTAYVMSEAPFRMFFALGLWGASRDAEGPRYAVIAAVGLVAAALTRSAGVVVIGAQVLYWLYRRQFLRAAGLSGFAASTVGAWTLWTLSAPDAAAHKLYGADLAILAADDSLSGNGHAILSGILAELPVRLQRFATVMVPIALGFQTVAGTLVDNLAWLALLLLSTSAGLVQLLRRWPVAAALLAAQLLLVILWTWELTRLLSPVTPLLYLTVLMGVSWWGARLPASAARPLRWLVVVLLTLGPAMELRTHLATGVACDRARPSDSVACFKEKDERLFLKMAEWVRDSTPADVVVFTSKEAAFSLRANRRGVNQNLALNESATTILPFLRKRGVSYLIVGSVGPRAEDHRQMALDVCSDLVLVRAFAPRSGIFRLRGLGEVPDGRACQMLAPELTSPGAEE